MSKIIIHNETSDKDDLFCLGLVKRVMEMGFTSGEKQYYWLTTFTRLGKDIEVYAMPTRGETFTFKVRSK